MAIEGILIGGARVIGYLDPSRASGRIVVDVKVRGLVEAVNDRAHSRWGEVVVNICIADMVSQAVTVEVQDRCSLHCDQSLFAGKRWHFDLGGSCGASFERSKLPT